MVSNQGVQQLDRHLLLLRIKLVEQLETLPQAHIADRPVSETLPVMVDDSPASGKEGVQYSVSDSLCK